MKLEDIYTAIVNMGMENDPRGKRKVKRELSRVKKEYDALSDKDKEFYDKERLIHPYSDSRILWGKRDAEIKNLFVGIDIEIGEILLADRLKEKGQKIDLLFSHHPEGLALAGFYNVMYMQIDILDKIGVPVNIAESLMDDRIREVERKISPLNHMRAVDAARLLDIAFITCHTPADNCVATYLQNLVDKKKPETLGEIMELLREIPEYREASEHGSGPRIIRGNPSSKAGKIFVDMTGGTEGARNIFSRLSQAGVSTLLCMHLTEEHFKKAREEHMNIIIAGHVASDNIGMNLVLDELERKARFNILTCSGFRRFTRR